ncbi:MAG: alkaline phosphatase D family protein, partial [Pseudomonadota bacterium]
SGDPGPNSIVLWTRVTTNAPAVRVDVEVATDLSFTKLVDTHTTDARQDRDYTVKWVADGLEPGGTYYFRFKVAGETSPTGRTRTLPSHARKARFAIASCSNYPFGYFNAYDHMARLDDIDAVIHLGDYIYEYGADGYGAKMGEALGRQHTPTREVTSLDDYRTRHAQYKSDPSAQAMHAAHPLIAIWDDHETSNDSWKGGAENHTAATEGPWEARRRAALQAYYEWMPIRDPEPGKAREALFKSYSWGGLLTLAAIETRLTARSKQLDYNEFVPTLKSQSDIDKFMAEIVNAPDRRLMGDAQMSYIEDALKRSKANNEPWRIIANQVIMAEVIAPNLKPFATEEMILELEKQWDQARSFIEFSTLGLPLNMDAWDGYPAAREKFYNMVKRNGVQDLIVLTGDTHEAWGNDLYTKDGEQMGVELGTTSVSSPSPSSYLGDSAFDYSLLLRKENKSVRFHDPLQKGYIILSLTEDKGEVEYVGLSTITSLSYEAMVAAKFDLKKSGGTVKLTNPKGLGLKERILF